MYNYVVENSDRNMTKAQLLTLLIDLGLREPEAQTYLEALSLGPTTVLALARQTGIKRTTLYTIVEELQHRGLMSTEVRGFKQKLVAAEPQRLESILNQQLFFYLFLVAVRINKLFQPYQHIPVKHICPLHLLHL